MRKYVLGFVRELLEESFSELEYEESYIDQEHIDAISELSTLILKLDNYDILNLELLLNIGNKTLIKKRNILRSNTNESVKYIDNYKIYSDAVRWDLIISLNMQEIEKVFIEKAYIYNRRYSLINSFDETFDALMIPGQNLEDEHLFYEMYTEDNEITDCNEKSCKLINKKVL